jgi:polyferredoxin
MHTMKRGTQKQFFDILATIFVLAIAIGGYFYPLLGLALSLLMALAVGLSLFGPRSRMFCSAVCPRGKALGFMLKPLARGKALPAWMLKLQTRRGLCGFMMFCVIGNLARNIRGFEGAGRVFWMLCVVSLTAGVLLGVLYRPRAWCAICPMGTLQDTVRQGKKSQFLGSDPKN